MTIFGLILDIVGVLILGAGQLRASSSHFRQHTEIQRPGGILKRIPVVLASRFGSRDPLARETTVEAELTANFWGLLLIFFGFVFQAVGSK